MKGIPYRTVWIEFADIKTHCISIGAEPTSYKINPLDGSKTPLYTLPVIHDPATGATVSDSFKIAIYLDKTYPSPSVTFVPAGTVALQAAFQDMLAEKIAANLLPLIILNTRDAMSDKSREWWLRTREEKFGKPVEELLPAGERPLVWKKALDGFKQVGQWLDANEGRGPFVMGEILSWGDVVIATRLLMLRALGRG